MASDQFGNEFRYKQRESSGLFVRNLGLSLQLSNYKRFIRMAQIKWALVFCDMLGIPATLLGIAANMNNIKSTILFIIAAIYLMLRAWFYAIRQQQEAKAREIENWHKQQDKIDRINKNKSL